MKNLIIIPTKIEMAPFMKRSNRFGFESREVKIGGHEIVEFPEIDTAIALGGLGKVQFGVQTQFYINKVEGLQSVLCVGAAGALTTELSIGDIVVATETVEHDIRKFNRPLVPRFKSNDLLIAQFRELANEVKDFVLHFGAIASGDEDIMDAKRKKEVRDRTNALAVAWEGAGGARACRLSNLPFVEIRGISDSADHRATDEFLNNLESVMNNLAVMTIEWAIAKKDTK